MSKNILLLSTSSLKLDAVNEAFTVDNHITTCACSIPGFPEQPIVDAKNTGFHFAKERMNFAKNKNNFDEYDYVISIENCMLLSLKTMNDPWPGDVCYVLIYSKGLLAHGESYGIAIDPKYSDALLYENKRKYVKYNNKIYGFSITIGEIINQENSNIDPKNWMKTLFNIDRKDQIIDAVLNALKDLYEKENIKKYLLSKYKLYPNYPKQNVDFEDMMPIFEDAESLQHVVKLMADYYRFDDIDYIVGPELRGIMLGVPLAYELQVGFIPIRKDGSKLPGEIIKKIYKKEYGTDALIMQKTERPKRVVIIDDLVATGGSLLACIEMCQELKMIVIDSFTLKHVEKLKGEYKNKLGGNHVTVALL